MTRSRGMRYQETTAPHSRSKFKGSCKELKGYIYDCSNVLDSDTFHTTTDKIAHYVVLSFKYGFTIRRAMETLTTPEVEQPTKPAEDATKTQILIWETKWELYLKEKRITSENIVALYVLVWGQCTYNLRQKLEALKEFEDMSCKSDGIALLKAIKNIAYTYQSHRYRPLVMLELMKRLYNNRQGSQMTNEQYLKKFQKLVAVIEHNGGGLEKMIAKELGLNPENLTAQQKQDVAKETQARFLAVAFILGTDPVRYGRLVQTLENDYLLGRDNYPKTINAAYNILTVWK